MSAITTHVLDTSRGRPASGIAVALEILDAENGWQVIGRGQTDAEGRLRNLLPPGQTLLETTYRLVFDTHDYFARQNVESFYTEVVITFSVRDATEHYHVPLLLCPFGYTTYRGS